MLKTYQYTVASFDSKILFSKKKENVCITSICYEWVIATVIFITSNRNEKSIQIQRASDFYKA